MEILPYFDPIKCLLGNHLGTLLTSMFSFSEEEKEELKTTILHNFCQPPSLKMGHLAFPLFFLSKKARKAPLMIAKDLESAILSKPLPKYVHSVCVEGPYLNIFLSVKECGEEQLESILDGSYFNLHLDKSHLPKTMIEYAQPNTHKELHVGHMRNIALGNSLVNLYRYSGHQVVSSTFPGDVGTHVAKTLWYMKYVHDGTYPSDPKKRGEFLGKMYQKAHNQLEEERGTPKEEENKKLLTQILKELHEGSGEFYNLWKETREWSLDQMKDLYKWANISFDHWYFESEVDKASVELIKEYFQRGVLTLSNGAIGLDLSNDGLGFCLLLKSDGNGLYSTKDVELARRKFEDYQIEKNIYVVDVRQSLHFAQVFKVLEKMGYKMAKNCFHLAYDFVELPEGAMSSRTGNIVPIFDLISEMVDLIKKNYLNQYVGNWSSEEIDQVANQVALGAINYGMLKIDPGRTIVFDLPEWLKLDGDSGPYIQYVCARISSLMGKMEEKFPQWKTATQKAIDWEKLKESSEVALIIKLIQFNDVIVSATSTYRPSQLCSYLFDLCKLFNNFYAECSILHAKTETLSYSRIALSKCVRIVLSEGLKILGIPTPKRM